jgi:hypothetical protein
MKAIRATYSGGEFLNRFNNKWKVTIEATIHVGPE